MTSVRRSFGVTFEGEGDPAVAGCLRDLNAIADRLRVLAAEGRCTFQDMTSQEVHQMKVVNYRTVYLFFKSQPGSATSQFAANTMQVLFGLRGSDGEPLVRFYCADYQEMPGMCTCPRLILPLRPTTAIRYRALNDVSVAHGWLMDRADLLKLTGEQIEAIEAHSMTRQRVVDFVTWLQDNLSGD